MDLQQAFSHFKTDLEQYIKEEVRRQVAAQNRSAGTPVVSSVSAVQAPTITIDESFMKMGSVGGDSVAPAPLDTLSQLANSAPVPTQNNAVDALVKNFGQTAAAPAAQATSNGDYLKDLANMSRVQARTNSASSLDDLMALSGNPVQQAAPAAPAQPAMTSPQAASSVSGIQSFLDKIRQRKNLGSTN